MEPSFSSFIPVKPMAFSEFSHAMNKVLAEPKNDNLMAVYRMFQLLKHVEDIPQTDIEKIKRKLSLRKIEHYPLLQFLDRCILPIEKRNGRGKAKQFAIRYFNRFGIAFQHRPELEEILNSDQKFRTRLEAASVSFYLLDKKDRTSNNFRACMDLFPDYHFYNEAVKIQVIGLLNTLLLFPKEIRAAIVNQCVSVTSGWSSIDIPWLVLQILFDLEPNDKRKNFLHCLKEFYEFNRDIGEGVILSVLEVYRNYIAKEKDYISFHTIASIVSTAPSYLKYENATAQTIVETEFRRCFKDQNDADEIKNALLLWCDLEPSFSDKLLFVSFVAKGATLVRMAFNSVQRVSFIAKLVREFNWFQNKKMILEYEYTHATSVKLLEFLYPPFSVLFSILPSLDTTDEYFKKLLEEYNLLDKGLAFSACRSIDLILKGSETFVLERVRTFFGSVNRMMIGVNVEKCEHVLSVLIPELYLHSVSSKRIQIDSFMMFMENLSELSDKDVGIIKAVILGLKKYVLNFDQLLKLSNEIIRNIHDTKYLNFLFYNFEFFFPSKSEKGSEEVVNWCLDLIRNRNDSLALCAAISNFAEQERVHHLTNDQLKEVSQIPSPSITSFPDLYRVIHSQYPFAKIHKNFLKDLQDFLFSSDSIKKLPGAGFDRDRIGKMEKFCLANYSQIGPLLSKWKSHQGHTSNQDILMVSVLLLPPPYRNYKGRHAMYDLIDRGINHEGFLLKGIELLHYIQRVPIEERVDLLAL